MLIYMENPALDANGATFRKMALKNAVLCLACLELLSVVCYILLFFFVRLNSEGSWSNAIQVMTLISLPLVVIAGALLLFGALKDNYWAIEIAFWWSLKKGLFNAILGSMGGAFFIYIGEFTIHYLISFVYWTIALSFITVLCHDLTLIHNFKRTIQVGNPGP